MEKELKKLFDYQRFEKNEKLEKLIRETEGRYAAELSDDDLSFVSAAGEETLYTENNVKEEIKGKAMQVGHTSTTFN